MPHIRTTDQLRGELTPAVVDAIREALTNMTKHAAVDTAVVRATLTADRLIISVLDHGIVSIPLLPSLTHPAASASPSRYAPASKKSADSEDRQRTRSWYPCRTVHTRADHTPTE